MRAITHHFTSMLPAHTIGSLLYFFWTWTWETIVELVSPGVQTSGGNSGDFCLMLAAIP